MLCSCSHKNVQGQLSRVPAIADFLFNSAKVVFPLFTSLLPGSLQTNSHDEQTISIIRDNPFLAFLSSNLSSPPQHLQLKDFAALFNISTSCRITPEGSLSSKEVVDSTSLPPSLSVELSTSMPDKAAANFRREPLTVGKEASAFFSTSFSLSCQSSLTSFSPMCFQSVFEEMHVNNFGRIITYLKLVYRLNDSCDEETIQEAVRRTVEALKLIDLEKYKVKPFLFNWLTPLFYNGVVMYVERCEG